MREKEGKTVSNNEGLRMRNEIPGRTGIAVIALSVLAAGCMGRSVKTPPAPVTPPPAATAAAPAPVDTAPVPAAKGKTIPVAHGLPLEITGRDGTPMVLVAAGTFDMGYENGRADEKPVHRVYLDAYYIDKFEVTNARFAEFLRGYGSDMDDAGKRMIFENKWGLRKADSGWEPQAGYENHPVVDVTWFGASQYAKHFGKRLPTEAEWEKACRGGSKTKWCFGDGEGKLGEYAWYTFNSGGTTCPVGQKKPNAYGIYDMHGNVWEWCADYSLAEYYKYSPARNPTGPSSSSYRISRGGSWRSYAEWCRSAVRAGDVPGMKTDITGFRCAAFPGSR